MNKDLKDLESLLAMLKNDSAVAKTISNLIDQEKSALEELALNEEKVEQLLDNPSEENVNAVVSYFNDIGIFCDKLVSQVSVL